MWFQHLEIVEANRKKGAKKSAATRKAKKDNKSRINEVMKDSDGDEVCNKCYSFNVEDELNSSEPIAWLACSSCALWYHKQCVKLEQIPDIWLCQICNNKL